MLRTSPGPIRITTAPPTSPQYPASSLRVSPPTRPIPPTPQHALPTQYSEYQIGIEYPLVPRPPQTRTAHLKRSYRKCAGIEPSVRAKPYFPRRTSDKIYRFSFLMCRQNPKSPQISALHVIANDAVGTCTAHSCRFRRLCVRTARNTTLRTSRAISYLDLERNKPVSADSVTNVVTYG